MSKKTTRSRVNRRTFLAASAAGGAAAALPGAAQERSTEVNTPATDLESTLEFTPPVGYSAEDAERYFVDRPGSDFMVDVIRSVDIDYIAINAGSSFRGLQESIVTYGNNQKPELLTCLHEEQAVALAHGYAKVAGKPMAVATHGTVGLQHAAMAVYNAWVDRVPIVLIGGNHLDAALRRAGIEWNHAAQDAARPLRDYTKWDDTPVSLQHFSESFVRAVKIATTAPMGPTVIIADGELQEEPMGDAMPEIPSLAPTRPPQGGTAAVVEAANLLVNADNPVILTDRLVRTRRGMDQLIELAETLQAPVIDRGARMNLPNTHYLNQTLRSQALIRNADVVLGLELGDMWGALRQVVDLPHRETRVLAKDDVKVISIGVNDLYLKSNYQDFQRYYASDLAIAGDGEVTLPALIEAVKRSLTYDRRTVLAAREDGWRADHAAIRQASLDQARYGWNASPTTTARLCAELWNVIKDKEWGLVSQTFFQSFWPERLWTMTEPYHHIGHSGGGGVGYGAPAAVGAALAHNEQGRLAVNIQPDGDMLYVPGAHWTAAHHNIPLLSVMHNNRGYHQEVMHLQRMAARRQRGIDGNAKIGNTFEDPQIDFAAMAKSLGVWSTGPINDPNELGPALAKALDVVEQSEPALVDVVCEPR